MWFIALFALVCTSEYLDDDTVDLLMKHIDIKDAYAELFGEEFPSEVAIGSLFEPNEFDLDDLFGDFEAEVGEDYLPGDYYIPAGVEDPTENEDQVGDEYLPGDYYVPAGVEDPSVAENEDGFGARLDDLFDI